MDEFLKLLIGPSVLAAIMSLWFNKKIEEMKQNRAEELEILKDEIRAHSFERELRLSRSYERQVDFAEATRIKTALLRERTMFLMTVAEELLPAAIDEFQQAASDLRTHLLLEHSRLHEDMKIPLEGILPSISQIQGHIQMFSHIGSVAVPSFESWQARMQSLGQPLLTHANELENALERLITSPSSAVHA